MSRQVSLGTIHRELLRRYGNPQGPPTDDPFRLVLWEQVAYLADDQKRLKAFEMLESRVGSTPQDILKADWKLLIEIASKGGAIAAEKRAARMQESARMVVARWDGNLRKALELPKKQAIRMLSKFPMIGEPGAEKIMLLTKSRPVLALDSNGLRVLLRLGYGSQGKNYSQTYRSVRASTTEEQELGYDRLISLHHLLHQHGRAICRRSKPQCTECPLVQECAFYRRPLD